MLVKREGLWKQSRLYITRTEIVLIANSGLNKKEHGERARRLETIESVRYVKQAICCRGFYIIDAIPKFVSESKMFASSPSVSLQSPRYKYAQRSKGECKMNADAVKDRLTKLAGRECWCDDENFMVDDYRTRATTG